MSSFKTTHPAASRALVQVVRREQRTRPRAPRRPCLLLALLAAAGSASLPVAATAGPVDINSADAATLARELDGVGESRARAIVEYREKNGPFARPDDLMNVSGVGPQILQQNRDSIRTGPAEGARPGATPAGTP